MAAYEITTLLAGRLGLTRDPVILSELLADEKDMAAALMQLEPGLFDLAAGTGAAPAPPIEPAKTDSQCAP